MGEKDSEATASPRDLDEKSQAGETRRRFN
jgi:hypothetical protein